jgi:GT2 family glycosyltransferase
MTDVRVALPDVGVVIIGRNEGERLLQCLRSTVGQAAVVVYVDSGSTDASVAAARSNGASVVELDLAVPFTAARARNAGFKQLMSRAPQMPFVQFVDGDCEIVPGWLSTARTYLAEHPDTAAVFGRRRERDLDASLYNQLCDDEWNVSPGDVKACGGDVMMRCRALQEVDGYRSTLIAGEEPELCVRLRQRGYRIVCLAAEMTRHDAAMTRFGQWWNRCVRAGHAFAEGAHLHGAPPERHWVAQSRRIWFWGAGIPAGIALATLAVGPIGLATALIYPAQVARLYRRNRQPTRRPLVAAAFQVLGNIPETVGQVRFHVNRLRGGQSAIIEYK